MLFRSLLFTGLFTDKVEGLTNKISNGDPKKVGILMIAAMCGAFAYLFGNELIKVLNPETAAYAVAGISAGISMLFLEKAAKKYPKLGEYNLGITMIIGMFFAVLFTKLV